MYTQKTKDWSVEDSASGRLLQFGKLHLSDRELLALVVQDDQVAEQVLADHKGLRPLRDLRIQDWKRYPKIGEAKAKMLVAIFEMGRRAEFERSQEPFKIRSSRDSFEAFAKIGFQDESHEEFWVMFLSRANTVIAFKRVSQGGTYATVVDAKMIFTEALEKNCSAIILAHNHPSGTLHPSDADMQLTRKLVQAGKVLDISVVDHILLTRGRKNYYSFADNGAM